MAGVSTIQVKLTWPVCLTVYYHSAAPEGVPSIVSHLVTADYLSRTCGTFFQPDDGYTYASANGKRPDSLNAWTKGWSGTTERVIWAQGYVVSDLLICCMHL